MSNKTGLWALGFIAIVLGTILWLNHSSSTRPRVPTREDRLEAREQAKRAAVARVETDERKQLQEKEKRHHDDLTRDAVVKAAFERSSKQRWTQLPEGVRNVYVDGRGRPWFSLGRVKDSVPIEDKCLSVEEVFAGKAMCLRGDSGPVLVDSKGTLWLRAYGWLAGYDGKKWTCVNTEGVEVPRVYGTVTSRFGGHAFEDSSGGLWFLTLYPHGFLHRTTDGRWRRYPLPRAEGFDLESLVIDGQILQLEKGRMLIARAGKPDDGMAYFDGSEWTVQRNLEMHPNVRLEVAWQAPLANGSIALFHSGSGDLWFYWPDPAMADNAQTRQWINDLDAEDAQLRRGATLALVRNGEAVKPVLERAAAHGGYSAEAALRMRSLIELTGKPLSEVAEMAGTHPDLPDRNILPGIKYRDMSIVGWNAGRAVLEASGCTDENTDEYLGDRYAELIGNGKVRVMQLSAAPWRADAIADYHRPFIDAQKRLWLPGGCRIRPDNTVEEALHPSMTFHAMAGPDAQSRLYLDSKYVLNENVPAPPRALPQTLVEAPYSMFAAEGHVLWAIDEEGWPKWLSRFEGTTRTRLECPWKSGVPLTRMLRPFGGGILVSLRGNTDPPPDFLFALFDGSRWDTDNDLDTLVKRNAGFLSSNADTVMRAEQYPILAGTADRFWFCHDTTWRTDTETGGAVHLQLYDGSTWHDVRADLNWTKWGAPKLTLVDGGRTLMVTRVSQTEDRVSLVTLDGQKMRETPLRTLPRRGLAGRRPASVYLAGETWVQDLTDDGRVTVLRDGVLSDLAEPAEILLGDSRGRGWLCDGKRIRVYDRGLWGEIVVEGAQALRRMGEDTFGRIWLLHSQGISRITVASADGKLALNEAARYPWNEPRTVLFEPGFDRAGGMWMANLPRGRDRIQLPPVE